MWHLWCPQKMNNFLTPTTPASRNPHHMQKWKIDHTTPTGNPYHLQKWIIDLLLKRIACKYVTDFNNPSSPLHPHPLPCGLRKCMVRIVVQHLQNLYFVILLCVILFYFLFSTNRSNINDKSHHCELMLLPLIVKIVLLHEDNT